MPSCAMGVLTLLARRDRPLAQRHGGPQNSIEPALGTDLWRTGFSIESETFQAVKVAVLPKLALVLGGNEPTSGG